MFKVINNFLTKEEHEKLKNTLESPTFPWYFIKGKVNKTDKPNLFDYQFVHIFYKDNFVNSDFFDHLNPIIKKLDPLSLVRIKANLNPITNKLIKSEKHSDQDFECKTAIYYVNDNDGYTMIEDKKVKSESNKIVLFNSNQKHYGTSSTNCNNRMVINFNYF